MNKKIHQSKIKNLVIKKIHQPEIKLLLLLLDSTSNKKINEEM